MQDGIKCKRVFDFFLFCLVKKVIFNRYIKYIVYLIVILNNGIFHV